MIPSLFKKILPFLLITLLIAGGVEIFYTTIFPRLMSITPTSQEDGGQTHSIADSPPPPAEVNADIGSKQNESQIILERKLFGQEPKKEVDAALAKEPPKQLNVTALDVSLLGTIDGAPNSRRVILLDKKKKVQNIYYQGDEVQGAFIKEIQRWKIVLTRNGTDEILVPEAPKKNVAGNNAPPASMSMPAGNVPPPPSDTPPDIIVEPEPIEPEAPVSQPPESAIQAEVPGAPAEPPPQPPAPSLPPSTNTSQGEP